LAAESLNHRTPADHWPLLPKISACSIALAPEDVPETVGERLVAADALLVEGPMASHAAWADAALRAAGWPVDRPIYRAGRGLVARGCLAAAFRNQAGTPVYYDFLPQLEINALVNDGGTT
jgi:hypothetical protein